MAAQPRYAGQGQVLPEATGQIIEFIRKPNKFKVNKYAQYIETPNTYGVYFNIDSDQPVRIIADADFAWADGDQRPQGNSNGMTYNAVDFHTNRRSYPWIMGEMAIDTQRQGNKIDWTQQNTGMVASQAMTNRTNRVITMMQTVGNWGDNTASANSINGGYGNWRTASSDPGSPYYLAIKRSIDNACKVINLKTNGIVQRSDMQLVISPGLASLMAETSEIYDYIKYGPFSKGAQEGSDRNLNEDWGLPAKLYGVEPVVEDSPIITIPPNSSGTYASITTGQRAYIKNDTTAVLTSRVGGIAGAYGAPAFSTVQIYFYGSPMEAETFTDAKNRRVEGYLTENYYEVVAAPAAGFLFTSVS